MTNPPDSEEIHGPVIGYAAANHLNVKDLWALIQTYRTDLQTRLDDQIAAGDHDLNEVRRAWSNCKLGWNLPKDVVNGMDTLLGTGQTSGTHDRPT